MVLVDGVATASNVEEDSFPTCQYYPQHPWILSVTSVSCVHPEVSKLCNCFKQDRSGNFLIEVQLRILSSCSDSKFSSPITSDNCIHPSMSSFFSFFKPDKFGNFLISEQCEISSDSNSSNLS
ncbi:hypothetical protein LINPERPRIM_LOCUS33737, partial [Linum perenne]